VLREGYMKGGVTIRSLRLILVLIGVVPILTAGLKDRGKRPGEAREISWEEFEDKVRGGWVGQMIGVTYGAPTHGAAHLAV
jgi:hypothetical protein